MKRSTQIIAGCLCVVGSVIAFAVIHNSAPKQIEQARIDFESRASSHEPAPSQSPAPANDQPASPVAESPATPVVAPAPVEIVPAPVATSIRKDQGAAPQASNVVRSKSAPAPVSPIPDPPIARQALSLVGADPVAEAVWVQAINDQNISAHDRSDLIEDLNEDGFDDPKNITADDLPLIENRLALIEQLAPSSMDQVNAAAFAEAYKDLQNMHTRVAGQ